MGRTLRGRSEPLARESVAGTVGRYPRDRLDPMTTSATYRERLLPSWGAWVLALGLVAMLAVAYGAALGATAGWLVAAGTGILAVALLLLTAPVISVSPAGLHVQGAVLPLTSIARYEAVTRDDIARLRGPGADARLFVSLRPWSAPGGVLVELDDPEDPHPAWLFTSRHPTRVTAALAATMAR